MATTSNTSFLRNAYAALLDARSRQAARYVNGALLMLDDATLQSKGYTREELRRRGAISPYL